MLVQVLFSIIICDKLRQCPSSVVTTCTMTQLHPRPPLIGGQLPPVCRQPPLIGSGSGSGHVTWILASDWSRLGPSQHRSQLWPESRALNPVSIWAASSDHVVSSVGQLQPKLSESSQLEPSPNCQSQVRVSFIEEGSSISTKRTRRIVSEAWR